MDGNEGRPRRPLVFSRRDLFIASAAAAGSLAAGTARRAAAAEAPSPAARIPRWFAYRCPYARFDAGTLERFSEAGVELIAISPLNTLSSLGVPYSPYPSTWVGPDAYDFEPFERYLADVRAAHPRARFICAIDLNTPAWWPRALWSERRIDSFCELGRIAADEEWRRETRAYLQAFLRRAESREADAIEGYLLACGMTLEWQDQSRGQESRSRASAWRAWMAARGLPDPVDIPPGSVRERVSHGIFRDPAADALAIRYWRFHHDLVAETILWFAAAAQEILAHRVPLGVFYGYVFEHGAGRLLYEGHLGFDKVCASPLIDFFVAPAPYHDREIGGASGFMVCLHSLKHRGKGFVQELDHRTHTGRGLKLLGKSAPGYESGFPDRASTIAGLRREFALALIEGTSLWWFNIFGALYDDPEVVRAIAGMRRLWDARAGRPDEAVAEVAVLVDAESMLYVDGKAAVVTDLLSRQRHGLGRMGAPYEVYSFADLPTLDLSRHKLVILPNLFAVDEEKRSWLREKVCTGGKTVLWVLAPGIIADGRYHPAHVEELTGIPYGTRELTARPREGWTSVFSPSPNLPARTLRRLAADAGVHIYCDAEEPLYASRRLLALHTASGGRRRFILRERCARVRELFGDRIVAEAASAFEDDLPAPATVLYALEPE